MASCTTRARCTIAGSCRPLGSSVVSCKVAKSTVAWGWKIVAVGMTADITVFDPETIAPKATYLDPVQLSVGVKHVLVNGGIALENGEQTGYRGGRFLKKEKA